MKKSIYLTVNRSKDRDNFTQEQAGYIFYSHAIGRFCGVCNGGRYGWRITDIKSGLYIASVNRRKDAFKELERLASAILSALNNEKVKKAEKIIKAAAPDSLKLLMNY